MERKYSDEFILKAEDGYLNLNIAEVWGFPNETCHWGGYDSNCLVKIKCSNYFVKGNVYVSTGNIYNFYIQLKECFEKLRGEAIFESYENNLIFKMVFDSHGHAKIVGSYKEHQHLETELIFELSTDQSYLNETVTSLRNIYEKYGDNNGIL